MDRRLLDYLPPVLREVLEFQAINNANEPEIMLAWDALALVMANQFIDTADARGVSIWEQELRIRPKDTDTLDLRKARIKAMWNLEVPYTVTWLRNWLTDLCGETGFNLAVEEYTIGLQLNYNELEDAHNLALEILDMLLMVRPANMCLLMTAYLESCGTLSMGACAEMATRLDIWPQVHDELESTGRLNLSGAVASRACIEIYPIGQEENDNAQ